MPLTLETLTLDNFDAFSGMFRDGGSGCYCASWRAMDDTWAARCKDPAKPNLQITKRNVGLGHYIGFLVYEGSTLVGWAGAGPKTEFPSTQSERFGARLSPFVASTWIVGCLAAESGLGPRDMFKEIVMAVITEARRCGAAVVEACPTRPWDRARQYRGREDLYSSLGFVVAGAESDGASEVLLMRLEL